MLNCAIVDSGCGFSDEKQLELVALLSKPEHELDAEIIKSNVSLFICKKLVEHSGGTLKAYSAGENRGATFQFSVKMIVPSGQDRDSSDSDSMSDSNGDGDER